MRRSIVHKADTGSTDKYQDKLLKYVPAEVLGAFVGLAALAEAAAGELDGQQGGPTWPIILVFALGVIATPGFLAIRASREDGATTRWYGYVLSIVAFVPWSLAASFPVRELFEVTPAVAEFLLALTVFVIPLLDFGFGKLHPPGPNDR